jgi:PAS domain S-box-containing protein
VADNRSPSQGEASLVATGAAHPDLLQALGVAVYITDAEGRLTSYNEAAAELWGWRPPLGETRWCGSWKLCWPDGTALAHADCPMGVALREGRTVRGVEAVAERPDGTRVPFIPYPTPLRDASGVIVGAVNVLVDISGRKGAEAALARNEARLRAVIETTPECIKLVAPDGTLMQMNAAGLRMIEAGAPEEAEGRSVFDLIAPEYRVAWRENHARVCGGEAVGWEFDVVGLRGTRRNMETHATPLSLPDGRLAHLAITRDVTPRKEAEERQALLAREVDHRAKNALAVALSLVRLTSAEDPRRFVEAVEGRIAALAHAHGLLAEEGWSGAELRAVAKAELAPYSGTGRIDLSGPPVWLAPTAVQSVAMVLHELATNAAKYGALSVRTGRVAVSWEMDPMTGDLDLAWAESGGPRIAEPARREGFGSRLIEATVHSQLGGAVRKDWDPAGLRCQIAVRADRLVLRESAVAKEARAADAAVATDTLAGRCVLLVEDELLVAMELEEVLHGLECEVLGPVGTLEEAMSLAQAEAGRIDAAVLDVNLAGRPSFPLADLLAVRGVPVVFATGYGDLPDGRTTGGSSLLLRKPLGRGELQAALSRLLAATPPANAARRAV